jgi:hypothetical protein
MAIGLCAIRQGDHGVAPYRQTITAPAAWTNRSIGGKAGLTHQLTPAQLAAFEIVLAGTRHLKPLDTTRSDFDHPEINAVADWLSETIRHGRGAVLLSGLTRAAHSEEDMERIYWYIGTCLGEPAVQRMLGDRLGHVQHVKDDPVARGYRSNEELTPHTDSYRIVGLMCLQQAQSGGMSRIVSSLAIQRNPRHAAGPAGAAVRRLPVCGRRGSVLGQARDRLQDSNLLLHR